VSKDDLLWKYLQKKVGGKNGIRIQGDLCSVKLTLTTGNSNVIIDWRSISIREGADHENHKRC
jgi:hypothetical protein